MKRWLGLDPSISKFGPLGVKEFDVFDLPFLMSDDSHARQMMASPMMADLNKKLEAKGAAPAAAMTTASRWGSRILRSRSPRWRCASLTSGSRSG